MKSVRNCDQSRAGTDGVAAPAGVSSNQTSNKSNGDQTRLSIIDTHPWFYSIFFFLILLFIDVIIVLSNKFGSIRRLIQE